MKQQGKRQFIVLSLRGIADLLGSVMPVFCCGGFPFKQYIKQILRGNLVELQEKPRKSGVSRYTSIPLLWEDERL